MAVPWRERLGPEDVARVEATAARADMTPRQLEWLMGDPGAGGGMAPIGWLQRPGGLRYVLETISRGFVGQVADGEDRAMLRENLALTPDQRVGAMLDRVERLRFLRGAARG